MKKKREDRASLDDHIKQWFFDLPNLEGISLQSVANKFCMSKRTVSRYLNRKGICFKALLCEERKRRCAIYHEEKLTVEEFVFLLGLRNVSHFYKAYKAWFGHRFVEDSKKWRESSVKMARKTL